MLNKLYKLTSCKNFLKESLGTQHPGALPSKEQRISQGIECLVQQQETVQAGFNPMSSPQRWTRLATELSTNPMAYNSVLQKQQVTASSSLQSDIFKT